MSCDSELTRSRSIAWGSATGISPSRNEAKVPWSNQPSIHWRLRNILEKSPNFLIHIRSLTPRSDLTQMASDFGEVLLCR